MRAPRIKVEVLRKIYRARCTSFTTSHQTKISGHLEGEAWTAITLTFHGITAIHPARSLADWLGRSAAQARTFQTYPKSKRLVAAGVRCPTCDVHRLTKGGLFDEQWYREVVQQPKGFWLHS